MASVRRSSHELDFDGTGNGQPEFGWLCLVTLLASGLYCVLGWTLSSIRLAMMPRRTGDDDL